VMGVMVNSKTKHTPAAVAFAHYVTDAEHQMSFAKKVAIFPSTAGSLDDPYFTKEDGTDETLSARPIAPRVFEIVGGDSHGYRFDFPLDGFLRIGSRLAERVA